MSRYRTLDENLIDEIEALPPESQWQWLILSPHERFVGRWKVSGLDPSFFFDFEEEIGQYRTVSPSSLDSFLDSAEKLDYKVVFEDDPVNILDAWASLNDPPPFSLNSDMPNTVNGFFSFQIQGFNYLRNDDLKGGNIIWSTGVGKSTQEVAMIKWFMEVNDCADLAVVFVKPNNKKDAQKKLLSLGDIESTIVDGPKKKRQDIYRSIEGKTVLVTNYEKLREDTDEWIDLVTDNRVLIFWDEMPTKLKNRGTKLYGSVAKVLYSSAPAIKWDSKRPRWLRQYQLTATPIENSPVDQLNCVRLIDPDVFPTIKEWEKSYVMTRNFFSHEPETFKNLDRMGLEIEFMTHQVDKNDPDIAKMFPDVIEEMKYIDWNSKHRFLYDKLQRIASDMIEKDEGDEISILPLISALQMLCDVPEMVSLSARNRLVFEEHMDGLGEGDDPNWSGHTGSSAALRLCEEVETIQNDGHAKIEALKDLLLEDHPYEKVIVFSTFSDYIFPFLEENLHQWGVSHVTYKGTDSQREKAKKDFRSDPSIRVLLSSDAGSDSIDLPEASVVIHYNSPWKHSTKIQRQNRAHRVNSTHETVRFYTLVMDDSVEYRKLELIEQKSAYQDGIYKGKSGDDSSNMRMTSKDLMYILKGS